MSSYTGLGKVDYDANLKMSLSFFKPSKDKSYH